MSFNCHSTQTLSAASNIDIAQTYHFVENIFDPGCATLANIYKPWERCLAVVDENVFKIHETCIIDYFTSHEIRVTLRPVHIPEDHKSIEKLLEICTWMNEFGLVRREPLLVIGGGLVTDVAG